MQTAGTGFRLPVEVLHLALADDRVLRIQLGWYAQYCEQLYVDSALASGLYSIRERVARWLLMCHERLDHEDFLVTQENLAELLGVRRSSVTDQIHVLEGAHAISSTRGRLRIISRPILQTIAGDSYGAPERTYNRVLERQGQVLPEPLLRSRNNGPYTGAASP